MYNAWQRTRTQNLRRVCENSGPLWPVYSPKFTKFSDDVGDRSYFPTPLPYWLHHVSFRRYVPLSLKVEKPNKCKSILEGWPTVLWQIISAIYCPSFGNVWLSSVCRSPSAKPSNELECRTYVGWVKCRYPDTPHFGHAFSNRTYARACAWFWLSFVQRAPRVAGE